MNDNFKGFWGFWRGVFSESDGTPSASRVTMFVLALTACASLLILIWTIFKTDVSKAGLVIASLPMICGALGLFLISPYGVNKSGNALSDWLQSKLAPKKDGQQPNV